ncbi:nuclear pore complex protein-like protein Nup107 [Sporormia fimetaria CBS 119925]|uniref:Nuclear pore complex protein n=1 Tax=Sporormia fimetaria CBS 119925 TaxID=1340428 RepID=A0A6A6V2I1_9PLEO|nr:nuclear pore complex protein-like protein Nup107 [Sporormia fimetaria CBS 119925]
MATTPRRSLSAALQPNGGSPASLFASRTTSENGATEDPLQPLRAMADRVGKEVELFAERVDQWHTQGNDSDKARYRNTLRLVERFKELADSTVEELREQDGVENRGELAKSVRRRIDKMAVEERPGAASGLPKSFSTSVIPSLESGANTQSSRVQELRHWQTEAATWDLLRVLIEHYHPEPGTDPAVEKQAQLDALGETYRYSENNGIWDRFVLQDDVAKEKVLVLRWLERTARNSESDIDSITQQLEAHSGKATHVWTSGWLDTKSKIKQLKRLQGADSALSDDFTGLRTADRLHEMVTQLDPDAPARQKRALEKSDEFYERALWMVCYEMLRRGIPYKDITEWCKDRSEGWRGVSLGAADESRPDGVPNISGPTMGYLFRRMCFYAAKGARTQYEAAAYALLSGDYKEVEEVCRTFDDHLYARYNALLLSRFDEYLLKTYPDRLPQSLVQKFGFSDAVANLGAWETSHSRVINLMQQGKDSAALSLLPMKLIQGGLIGRNLDELTYKVGVAIAILLEKDNRATSLILDPEDSDTEGSSLLGVRKSVPSDSRKISAEPHYKALASDPHALRVLVHVFIVLHKGLGLYNREEHAERAALDNVIVAYIEILRISKRFYLIPLYAAQLEGDRCYHCLARILPEINDPEEQRNMVGLMEQYKIDPVRVVTENYLLVSNNILHKNKANIERYSILEPTQDQDWLWPGKRIQPEFPGMKIEPDDEAVMESLRWHLHLDKEMDETFNLLHSGLVHFLLTGRVGAAIQLVEEMNIERLSAIKTQALCGYEFNFRDDGAEIQDEELLRLASSDHDFTSSRSSRRAPRFPTPAEHATIVERLRENSQSYQDLQNLVFLIRELRQWRQEEEEVIRQRSVSKKPNLKPLRNTFDTITDHIDALTDSFLDTIDPAPQSPGWYVRIIYIPEVILAYLTVVQAFAYMSSSQVATKAMDIATVIAQEDKKWWQGVFLGSKRMSELVDMLALVSRAMLRLNEVEGARKKKTKGVRGETVRIWDVHSRN